MPPAPLLLAAADGLPPVPGKRIFVTGSAHDHSGLYELVEGVDRKVDSLDEKVSALDVKLDRRLDELSGQLAEVLRQLVAGAEITEGVVRGDQDVNEAKLKKAVKETFNVGEIALLDTPEVRETWAIGFCGPDEAVKRPDTVVVIDPDAAQGGFWATGASSPRATRSRRRSATRTSHGGHR